MKNFGTFSLEAKMDFYLKRQQKSQVFPQGRTLFARLCVRLARCIPLYGARTTAPYTVGASLCAPATQTFCTMRNFVSKRNATFLPSLERGGGPHVSVFQFSIRIFSALNYKFSLSVNDCGGGVVANGLFRSLLCSLQKESLHKSLATTHHSSVSPVEKATI